MSGKVSSQLWRLIASAWMCIEIGQFLGSNTGLASNNLYWPLWTAISLVVLLGALVLDSALK
jgi:hypothetical protein